jgi:hypothetical protein
MHNPAMHDTNIKKIKILSFVAIYSLNTNPAVARVGCKIFST